MKPSREESIRTAASRLFATKGYQATGIADVARELGMGHGTFYRYFEDKRDVFESVVEEALLAWSRAVPDDGAAPANGAPASAESLRAYGLAKLALFDARPELRPLLFRETPALDASLAARLATTQRACAGELELLLLEIAGRDTGAAREARPAAALLAARLFDLLREPPAEGAPAAWDAALSLILRGFRAGKSTAGPAGSQNSG